MGFLKKTDYNATVAEIEKKTPSISGLATTSAFNEIENKIPDVSSLVKKKTNSNTKITENEKKLANHDNDKNITTPEFNNLAARVFTARLLGANSITKANYDD